MSERADETIVFLCECGPIIRDLVDLDELGERAAGMEHVGAVVRHATLCSADGRAFVTAQLAEHPGMRPVFAACSPREHAETLGSACEAAGVNRYLMGRANIREQCAWVTPDKAAATEKAAHLTQAAVARALANEPLTAPEIECETGVLVLGAGVAGMNAALALADGGRKVTLVEREASIGGRVVLLGELYPDMDCAPCLLEPLMDHVMHHPNIEVLLQSELDELVGYLGNFTARIRTKARHVAIDGCYACRACSEVCPVSSADPVDCGMSERKAVHIPYAGALPNASVVDESVCLHFTGGECDLCVGACAFGAIDLSGEDTFTERVVGGVLVATGSDVVPLAETGTGGAVVTTYEIERILNPDGPTGGELKAADGSVPHMVALVHCAGSDGAAPVETCSRTCCLTLAKTAHEIAHKNPDVRVIEFTWDRVPGGPHFVAQGAPNGDTMQVVRMEADSTLQVVALPEGGARIEFVKAGQEASIDVDLAVVATPQIGSASLRAVGDELGVDLTADGFVIPSNTRLRSFAARREGVFVAGSAQGPKDVTAAASQGVAAAGALLSGLVEGTRLVREAATAIVTDELCGGCRLCSLVCPYRAIGFDDGRRIAVINQLLCQGCGTCVATCPSSAIRAKHFSDRQLISEIDVLAEAGRGIGSDGA